MKTVEQIDQELANARSLWLSSGIRGMNKYIPLINKLLDSRLKITKQQTIFKIKQDK